MAIGIGTAIAIFNEDRDRDRDLNFGDRAHALAKIGPSTSGNDSINVKNIQIRGHLPWPAISKSSIGMI